MSKRNALLKGSTVLILSLAYGCSTPGGLNTPANVASGPSLNGAGLISNNAGGLISNNAGGLISNNAGGLISNNAGGLISNNAGGLISNNAGGLISNNAGGLTGTVSGPSAGLISNNAGGLISNNAGGLISNNAGGLISNNAGGLISNNAGGYRVFDASSGNTQPIPGARVAVFNERGEQVSYSWATTDANGGYTFKRLKASGPLLFVKAVYQAEGQQISLMSTVPAPRKPGVVTSAVTPATTLVAKKVEEMTRLRAVSVASVHQETVDAIVAKVAPVMSDKAVVAAVIFPADDAAKTFDAMVNVSPALAASVGTVAASAGVSTLVNKTPDAPVNAAPDETATPTPVQSTATGGGGTTDPSASAAPSPSPSASTAPFDPDASIKATIFTLGKVGNARNLAVQGGNVLLAPGGGSLDTGTASGLTSAVTFTSSGNAATAVAFDGATEYTFDGTTISGGGKSAAPAEIAGADRFVVVNGFAYVTSQTNNCIYKVDLSAGTASVFAGQVTSTGGFADGQGGAAQFKSPRGITFANGNLYVADRFNRRIRQVTLGGAVTSLAGNGLVGASDGQGTGVRFGDPTDLTADASGNLYVADSNNQVIRKVTTDGTTTTIAGNRTFGDIDGVGKAAELYFPTSIAFGTVSGTPVLFVGEDNGKVRLLSGW